MEKKPETHELKHTFSPKAMSRRELDHALSALKRTYNANNNRIFASCYEMAEPGIGEVPITCDLCGKQSSLVIQLYSRNNFTICDAYNELAAEFSALGYKAKMSYYCDDCVSKDPEHLAPIVFSFQAEWMKEPVLSYPDHESYNDKDYRLAIDFLKGADSAGILYDIHGRGEDDDDDSKYYERVKRIVGPEPQNNTPPQDERHIRRGKTGSWRAALWEYRKEQGLDEDYLPSLKDLGFNLFGDDEDDEDVDDADEDDEPELPF